MSNFLNHSLVNNLKNPVYINNQSQNLYKSQQMKKTAFSNSNQNSENLNNQNLNNYKESKIIHVFKGSQNKFKTTKNLEKNFITEQFAYNKFSENKKIGDSIKKFNLLKILLLKTKKDNFSSKTYFNLFRKMQNQLKISDGENKFEKQIQYENPSSKFEKKQIFVNKNKFEQTNNFDKNEKLRKSNKSLKSLEKFLEITDKKNPDYNTYLNLYKKLLADVQTFEQKNLILENKNFKKKKVVKNEIGNKVVTKIMKKNEKKFKKKIRIKLSDYKSYF